MGVCVQRHAPAALTPGIKPGTHIKGGWVGPRNGVGVCRKSRPPTGIRSPDRPAGRSRYTDWAIPAHLVEVEDSYLSGRDALLLGG